MAGDVYRKARIASVVAGFFVALACGTNYAYSAWSTSFGEALKLSSTQSNLIGVAGNVGMYTSGIPVGLLVDRKGPRPAFLIGSVLLGSGYFALHRAYNDGAGRHGLALLCFMNFLVGCGGCNAFSASIKTITLNWPNHRGTATAFPLGGFGLSAFFFTVLSGFAFPDDTSEYLLALAVGTLSLILVGSLFLRVLPPAEASLEAQRPPVARRDSNPLRHTIHVKPGYSHGHTSDEPEPDENSSLMSKASSGPGDLDDVENSKPAQQNSHRADITGLELLRHIEFWQLWIMLGVLAGVGAMSINNIGTDSLALWENYDGKVSRDFIRQRQLMHVSFLSLMSFCGRILSGIGSDLLVKRMHLSRFWCLTASAMLFAAAQICATRIENPNLLWAVSGLTGLAYGALFGVYPALVADTYDVRSFSTTWGMMITACVIWGAIFNYSYGRVFDHHSSQLPDGRKVCSQGVTCYATAYWITFLASIAALGISLWSIRYRRKKREQQDQSSQREA